MSSGFPEESELHKVISLSDWFRFHIFLSVGLYLGEFRWFYLIPFNDLL
jgi:hypothetical protein